MIVMPGFVDTHYHMWSALGRNFVGDGFGYFAAKNATSKLFEPADFYNSVMLGLVELANAGITTVHNWSHNTRTPAHAERELRAHRESMLRALYSHGHVDQMPRNELLDFAAIDRVKREYFAGGSAFDGLVTYRRQPARRIAERGGHLPQGDGRSAQARPADRDPRRPGAAQPHHRRRLREARLARSRIS